MNKIKAEVNTHYQQTKITKFDVAYNTVKGDKAQQERAKKLLQDLKAQYGVGNDPISAKSYEMIAAILSKDENATAQDVLNTYNKLDVGWVFNPTK